MKTGGRVMRLIGLAAVVCAAIALSGWGISRGAAEEQQIGRYQVAVPDLVLDTATGKLTDSQGQVLEQPVDPAGDKVGRYSVDGYVTAVTRSVGLNMINQPVAQSELVKGYVLLDTQSGQVLKQRIYYRQALQPGDL